MIKKNQNALNFINMLSDVILTLFSYIGSMYLRFDVLHGVENISLTQGAFSNIAILYSILIVIIYYLAGLYDSFRFRKSGVETIKVFMLNAIGVLCLIALLYLIKYLYFTRIGLMIFWIVSSSTIIIKKYVVRVVLRYIRAHNLNLKHYAIVGNGKLAQQFLENIAANPYLGVCVDGYISGVEKESMGTCLGRYEDISGIIKRNNLDCVVIALEPHEATFLKPVLKAVEKEGIRVELIPFYNDYIPSQPMIECVGTTKLIDLRATPMEKPVWAMTKRLMDIVGSVFAITLLCPIMIITAIGVKITSPGPVFFKQKRVGKDQKEFTMLKFRSMRSDIDHSGWSTNVDPRKTRFGSFIRKFSIDELPQFFNVLVGNMSLVGPRPEIPKYVRQFKEEVPLYLLRQQAKPGITGWAQVHGLRGDTSIEERVKYDIWYIENWSLGLDVRILLKTVFGGFMNQESIHTGGDNNG